MGSRGRRAEFEMIMALVGIEEQYGGAFPSMRNLKGLQWPTNQLDSLLTTRSNDIAVVNSLARETTNGSF